jgi:anti-anti-sigma factor
MEEQEQTATVLSPAGRLDGVTVFDFEPEVTGVIDAGCRCLILDLSQLTYLSSAGLRLILRAVQKLRAHGGALAIAAPGQQVLEILSIAGFPSFIPIGKTVAEAQNLCGQQSVKAGAARFSPELGLNLPESFCLLAFDAKEGGVKLLPELSIVPAACAVMELALLERLDWDLNLLRVADRTPTRDPVLDSVLQQAVRGAPQSVEKFLRRISHDAPELERGILLGLVKKSILAYRAAKIARVFPVQKLVVSDPRPLAALREDLRTVLIANQVPDLREAVLVGLLDTCSLFAGILSTEELEECRSRIAQLSQLDLIGSRLPRLIHEIRRHAIMNRS